MSKGENVNPNNPFVYKPKNPERSVILSNYSAYYGNSYT
jgi:hypothetical protein